MLTLDAARDQARQGRLYPSVILYGSRLETRQQAALELARPLLCEAEGAERPCQHKGLDQRCRHCRRLAWPEPKAERFHPDLHVLERDLRTVTSVDATKSFLRQAYSAPFEARGQVFIIAEAETLSGGAADALLKLLEEPPIRSPRHFFLLAASRLDLLATLRSRSLSIFLGSPEELDEKKIDETAEAFGRALDGWLASSSPIYLLTAAEALGAVGGFKDPRARKPWATAASAVVRAAGARQLPSKVNRALLALAEELLAAPQWRIRAITHGRILEGFVARFLDRP